MSVNNGKHYTLDEYLFSWFAGALRAWDISLILSSYSHLSPMRITYNESCQ